jgi:hypothetical protein
MVVVVVVVVSTNPTNQLYLSVHAEFHLKIVPKNKQQA